MGFASTYLEHRALFPEIIKEAPDDNTGIIVIIPAYNEPDICRLLNSLALCNEPECKVEVIVVVNAPENVSQESIENNRLTLTNIESWKKRNNNSFFRLFAFMADQTAINKWGVGLARKTGMDEAVRRFNYLNNPNGVILNIDADCRVEPDYLVSVCNELLKRYDRIGCSVYFEHPVSGNEYSASVLSNITLYELHLRYFLQGLSFTGYPYVFHTVGSAMAVKALPYLKAGGMNRRQAGEDFYFIQKLVSSDGYFSLNSTTVYPSPRVSNRVPFGTGASVGKLAELDNPVLLTYNMLAFIELRCFFEMTGRFFDSNSEELGKCYELFPHGLKTYLDRKEWIEKIMEIKNNTAGLISFRKRFFEWFNMFRIVKYLNFVHMEIFSKKPVETPAGELLEIKGIHITCREPLDLLLSYRAMEKNR
jgi:hypothetical protein